MNIKHSAHRV